MAKRTETLSWRDCIGTCTRTLELSRDCPQCGCRLSQRMDTHAMCEHPVAVPVTCMRCTCWYALPRHVLVGKPGLLERAWAWLTRTVWA